MCQWSLGRAHCVAMHGWQGESLEKQVAVDLLLANVGERVRPGLAEVEHGSDSRAGLALGAKRELLMPSPDPVAEPVDAHEGKVLERRDPTLEDADDVAKVPKHDCSQHTFEVPGRAAPPPPPPAAVVEPASLEKHALDRRSSPANWVSAFVPVHECLPRPEGVPPGHEACVDQRCGHANARALMANAG